MQTFGKIIMIILFIIVAIYIIVSSIKIIQRIKEIKNEKRQPKPTQLQTQIKNSTQKRTNRIYQDYNTRSKKRIRQKEQTINGTGNSINTNNNNSINSSQENK